VEPGVNSFDDRCQQPRSGLNLSEMELLPTAVRDPKNNNAELQTPPSQTLKLYSDGVESLISPKIKNTILKGSNLSISPRCNLGNMEDRNKGDNPERVELVGGSKKSVGTPDSIADYT
jgi:hypothetical protein